MNIFITGGSGLIGQYLNIELSKQYKILTQYNQNIGNCGEFNSVKFSITDENKLEEVFRNFKPSIVIHTAAIPTPEKADQLSANEVYNINVNSTTRIAQLCDQYKTKLFYTSTDLVYAGYRGSMLKEDAKLIPISLYAETKLMGEVKIQETFDNYVILRVALQVGIGLNHSQNNFHKIFLNLKSGQPVKLYTDQFRTPLALLESARIIKELVDKNVNGEIINFAGNERVSRFELGELLCDAAGFDKNLLVKTTMEEAGVIYKVADISMSNEKLKSFGINIKPLDESISNAIKYYKE